MEDVDEKCVHGCTLLDLRSPRKDPREAKLMVGLGGLEPPTSPLSGARSNHLSYRPKDLRSGGADRDRTGDPRVANAVLSQLSYSPRWDVLFLDMQVSCVDAMRR